LTNAMIPSREIPIRLARHAATLDASALWPEISAPAFLTAQAEIARVTAEVLASAPEPVRLAVPAGADSRALGVAAYTTAMGPLLGYWCEIGSIVADPAVADLLATHLEHGRRRAVRLRGELERVLAALAHRSVDVAILKGMHSAYRYFPDPGTRPVADIDLLIRPETCAATADALSQLGFVPKDGSGLKGGDWIPPGVAAYPHSLEFAHVDDPWSVDLHLSLDREFFRGLAAGFGVPGPEGFEPWEEFAGTAQVLTQPLLLAYLALHAASHFYTMPLIRVVELVLVARRDLATGSPVWRSFEALVTAQRAGRFVYATLELAERLAPGSVDRGVLERLAAGAPRPLRRVMRRTAPGALQRLHPQPVESFLWVGSPGDLLAYAAHLLCPHRPGERFSLRETLHLQRRRIRRVISRLASRLGPERPARATGGDGCGGA